MTPLVSFQIDRKRRGEREERREGREEREKRGERGERDILLYTSDAADE